MDLTPVALVGGVVQPPLAIDLTAVFLAGLTGAVFAVQRKFAISGVFALAIVTGLGGGILRDIMLNTPPVALTNPRYLPTVFAAGAVGFFFASLVHRWRLMLDVLDPIWMGLFAVIGAQMALNTGQTPFAAILIGCVTAFGGGVLRDVLAGDTPQLVLPGPINYFAAIIGSILYVTLVSWLSVPESWAEWATILMVFGLRMLALRFGLRAPEPVDLPNALVKRGRVVLHLDQGDDSGAEAAGTAVSGGKGPAENDEGSAENDEGPAENDDGPAEHDRVKAATPDDPRDPAAAG